MSLLHKLWDETLAGPTPDTGLSKLRKFDSSHSPLTPIITIISPNSDSRGFSSDSDLLTSRSPTGDLEKFARGKSKSSVQSPVRAVTTTPTEFYWRGRDKTQIQRAVIAGKVRELHEILRMEEEEEEEEEEESRTC